MSVLDAQSYTMVQGTMCIHAQRLPRQASRHFTDMLVMSQLWELNSAPPTLSRTVELSDMERIAVCGCAAPTEASLFAGLLQNRGLFKFKASWGDGTLASQPKSNGHSTKTQWLCHSPCRDDSQLFQLWQLSLGYLTPCHCDISFSPNIIANNVFRPLQLSIMYDTQIIGFAF